MKISSKLLNIISIVITFIAFIYLWKLYRNLTQNLDHLLFKNIYWKALYIPLLISTLGGFFNSLVWHLTILRHGSKISFHQSYWAWSVSRLYRYIPGKIFGIASRYHFQINSGKSFLFAAVTEILISYIPIFYIGFAYILLSNHKKQLKVGSSILLLLIILSMIFSRYLLNKAVPIFPASIRVNIDSIASNLLFPIEIFKFTLLSLPAIYAHGGSFYFLCNIISPDSYISYFRCLVSLYTSGFIGQITFIMPAGIGVREGVLTFLLIEQGFSEPSALLISVFSRFILFASEIINTTLSGFFFILKDR